MKNLLVYFNQEFSTKKELFDFLAKETLAKNIVKDSYLKSIEEREEKYPTGLKLQDMNVAIVHTDVIHSLQNALCIVGLKKPILFKNAENFEDLKVDLIIGLMFENGNKHMEMLQKVAIFLQDQAMIKAVNTCQDEQAFQKIFIEYFGGEENESIEAEN